MIKITNLTTAENWDNPIHTYSVAINKRFICKFEHIRSEGLAVCLGHASAAVKASQDEELSSFLDNVGFLTKSSSVSNPKNDKRRSNGKHITAKNKIITSNKTAKPKEASITPQEVVILFEEHNSNTGKQLKGDVKCPIKEADMTS